MPASDVADVRRQLVPGLPLGGGRRPGHVCAVRAEGPGHPPGVRPRHGASAAEFAKLNGFTFDLGLDPNEDLAYAYGVIGYPTHFFIGRDGTVQAERFGRLAPDEMTRLVSQIVQ